MGSIAEAMMAARNVNQKAVQGGTNAARTASLKSGQTNTRSEDDRAYSAYQQEMAAAGRRPVSFKQWQMMYRHTR